MLGLARKSVTGSTKITHLMFRITLVSRALVFVAIPCQRDWSIRAIRV